MGFEAALAPCAAIHATRPWLLPRQVSLLSNMSALSGRTGWPVNGYLPSVFGDALGDHDEKASHFLQHLDHLRSQCRDE